jgi:two-component system OmpR family sensor kinase
MLRFKLQFAREFHLALAMLLLATLAIAWFYNDSIKQHKDDVQQITLANNVLQGYLQLANLTFRELGGLRDKALLGESSDLTERGPGASALRSAISAVRQGIAQKVAFRKGRDESEELEQAVEIEHLVEEIIRTSELIEQALSEGRNGDARNELDTLIKSGIVDDFNALIVAATADQKVDSWNEDRKATGLIGRVVNLLPILMTALVIIIFLFILVLSRHLTNSVNELHQGALAFRNGDLSYRIPKLSEMKFRRLAEVFNAMALQLSDYRKQLRETNIQLEKTTDDRTHELQESNRKLAAADVYRRKLLANISHEFRTPLTVIRGEAEIALRGSNKSEMDQRESFQRIVDQVENATRLVDDLLFIARADAGEPRLKLSSVSIASMIDLVCQEFAARAEDKGIRIEQGRLPAGAVVQGDSGRLRQVFAILLENAIRYSNPGGRVEVQVLQGDESVKIIFRDEGIGLTDEEAELAFERFYRAPMAVEKAAGTGLGLPVAKAIVEAHNGSISLSGNPGQGATATVVIPFGSQFGIFA